MVGGSGGLADCGGLLRSAFVKFWKLGSVGGGEEDREGAEGGGGEWGFEDGGEGLVVERMGGCGFGIGGHGAPVQDVSA